MLFSQLCPLPVRPDLISSGLGSPEILPSVLEHGAVGVSPLDQADDSFVLQPTPQGVKSYCIIQRTRLVSFPLVRERNGR